MCVCVIVCVIIYICPCALGVDMNALHQRQISIVKRYIRAVSALALGRDGWGLATRCISIRRLSLELTLLHLPI